MHMKLTRPRSVAVTALAGIVACVLAVMVLGSCQQFFTTSLAEALARDPDSLVPDVDASNAADLAELAQNDPAMAMSVLDGINDAMAGASAADQVMLRTAAVDAAASASGIGPAVLSVADQLAAADESEIIGIMDQTLAGLGNLEEAADGLLLALPDPADTVAFDAFVAAADPGQLAVAALTLMASEAASDPDGIELYIDGIDPDNPVGESQILAIALATAAAAQYEAEGGDDELASMLASLNLTTK